MPILQIKSMKGDFPMRKSVCSIGYLFIVLLISAGFLCSYHLGKEKEDDNTGTAVEADADGKVQFVLGEENGKVLVLLEDGCTVYEYTDIPVGNLPENIQNEITAGKCIENAAELYSFLENYSS